MTQMADYKPTTKEVQELRQRTGAGMLDCKNALVETEGNLEKAIELLRTRGIAKAEKRAGRVASEGRIVLRIADDGRTGVMLELNSETDFVARNEDFGAVVESLAEQVMRDTTFDGVVPNATDGALLGQRYHADGAQTVQDVVTATSARTGENVVLRRYARVTTDGTLGSYVHHNGRVAALVEVTGPRSETATELARRVAEHVAAGVPRVPEAVRPEDVPADLVERERRIYEEKALAEGKPEKIVGKVVEGQLRKFFAEVTLLQQPWVRDESKTIEQLLDDANRQTGGGLSVRRFVRYRMGEE
ncbi:MAG TPA: translation elongation factor Ts [Gemmatimonadaceae bacterium]|nr:translation elongation factor Ts [Gemmatimonadaceae bacterium]